MSNQCPSRECRICHQIGHSFQECTAASTTDVHQHMRGMYEEEIFRPEHLRVGFHLVDKFLDDYYAVMDAAASTVMKDAIIARLDKVLLDITHKSSLQVDCTRRNLWHMILRVAREHGRYEQVLQILNLMSIIGAPRCAKVYFEVIQSLAESGHCMDAIDLFGTIAETNFVNEQARDVQRCWDAAVIACFRMDRPDIAKDLWDLSIDGGLEQGSSVFSKYLDDRYFENFESGENIVKLMNEWGFTPPNSVVLFQIRGSYSSKYLTKQERANLLSTIILSLRAPSRPIYSFYDIHILLDVMSTYHHFIDPAVCGALVKSLVKKKFDQVLDEEFNTMPSRVVLELIAKMTALALATTDSSFAYLVLGDMMKRDPTWLPNYVVFAAVFSSNKELSPEFTELLKVYYMNNNVTCKEIVRTLSLFSLQSGPHNKIYFASSVLLDILYGKVVEQNALQSHSDRDSNPDEKLLYEGMKAAMIAVSKHSNSEYSLKMLAQLYALVREGALAHEPRHTFAIFTEPVKNGDVERIVGLVSIMCSNMGKRVHFPRDSLRKIVDMAIGGVYNKYLALTAAEADGNSVDREAYEELASAIIKLELMINKMGIPLETLDVECRDGYKKIQSMRGRIDKVTNIETGLRDQSNRKGNEIFKIRDNRLLRRYIIQGEKITPLTSELLLFSRLFYDFVKSDTERFYFQAKNSESILSSVKAMLEMYNAQGQHSIDCFVDTSPQTNTRFGRHSVKLEFKKKGKNGEGGDVSQIDDSSTKDLSDDDSASGKFSGFSDVPTTEIPPIPIVTYVADGDDGEKESSEEVERRKAAAKAASDVVVFDSRVGDGVKKLLHRVDPLNQLRKKIRVSPLNPGLEGDVLNKQGTEYLMKEHELSMMMGSGSDGDPSQLPPLNRRIQFGSEEKMLAHDVVPAPLREDASKRQSAFFNRD
jgi:hypothetical protein